MIWLKHIILALAAVMMTAGSAMSCCQPDHGNAEMMLDTAHNTPKDHHQSQLANSTSHPCDKQSNDLNEPHSSDREKNETICNGCADCAFMTEKANVHLTAIQIKVDHEFEQIVQAQSCGIVAEPVVSSRRTKPPPTAPPIPPTPVSLKQILIV